MNCAQLDSSSMLLDSTTTMVETAPALQLLSESLHKLSMDNLKDIILRMASENEKVAQKICDTLQENKDDRYDNMDGAEIKRCEYRSADSGMKSNRASLEILPFLPIWNWSYYYYKETSGASTKRLVVDEASAEESRSRAYYWNEEFQEISKKIRDVDLYDEEQAYISMANLYHDFEYAVETYGKIIIAERFLPVSQKSIPPAYYMGGHAGGEKYIVQGILFKFAVDKNDLYGGDHYAAKAAGHELKSLIQVYKSRVPDLYVPMMCLVDYLGYRLIAMSMLPVDTTTLCYGSGDGGMDVHDDIPEFNAMMGKLGNILNLKPHSAGAGGKVIIGPCDIEGHRGRDNQFYLLDFARLFPPECPPPISRRKNEYLYCLLRPELVKKYDMPLSSDAFTLFGKRDADVHNKEVKMATDWLHNTLIPKFAGILDFQEDPDDYPKHPNHYKLKITEEKLAEILHREGINIRHLGKIRAKVQTQRWREALLIEILARVIKNVIRENLRLQMKELKHPGLVPYRKAILDYLNLVLGNSPSSAIYWRTVFLEKIEALYEEALHHERSGNVIHLKNSVDLPVLFAAIRRLTGIVFSPHCISSGYQFFNAPAPFQDTDLLSFPPKVKEMRIAAYASATALYLKAKYNPDKTESERLSALASYQFQSALRSSPDDDMILCNYALLLRLQKRFEEAFTYYKAAIQSNPRNPRIFSHFAWFLYYDLKHYDKAEKYYLKTLEIDPNHSRTLSDYATFLWKGRKDMKKAEEYYKRAVGLGGDKQAFGGYASFLSEQGRVEEARYYEEHVQSAYGTLILNGKHS